MAAETNNTDNTFRFEIAGQEYLIPPLDDMDMDEWQIIYDYSGLVLEDFAPAADRADEQVDGDEDGPIERARQRRVGAPAFTTALLHIGYRRAHPAAKPEAIKKLVGTTKRLHVLEAMSEAVEEDAPVVPLALTPEPEPSSPAAKGNSKGSGSNSSQTGSGALGLHRVPTGTSG